MNNETTALSYIRKIRNSAKQQYAFAYFVYLTHPEKSLPIPDAKVFGIGCMGAQAVRMRLSEMLDSYTIIATGDLREHL